MEKQGKAHGFPATAPKKHLRLLLFKQPLVQQFLCCHHLVQHPLVISKFLYEPEDQGDIFPPRKTEPDGTIHSATSYDMFQTYAEQAKSRWTAFRRSFPMLFLLFL